jgi:uncharacterized membrane protein YkoI
MTIAITLAATGIFANPAVAQNVTDVGTVISMLQAAGYSTVRDVELDDGLWEAEVRGSDGRWYDLHIDPSSGAVIDRNSTGTLLTAAEISKLLNAAGYSSVHELELDEAVWDAEALDAQNRRVEVRLNGFTGAIVATGNED